VKIEIGLNQQAKVSFEKIPAFNPFVNEPIRDGKGNPTYTENWMELPHSVALALQELQDRIKTLESDYAERLKVRTARTMAAPAEDKKPPRKPGRPANGND
jgi:hypothetical protein